MRTTLDIDDIVLERVKLRARHAKVSTGQMVSELVRQQLDAPAQIVVVNGLPVLRGKKSGNALTMAQAEEFQNRLLQAESGL